MYNLVRLLDQQRTEPGFIGIKSLVIQIGPDIFFYNCCETTSTLFNGHFYQSVETNRSVLQSPTYIRAKVTPYSVPAIQKHAMSLAVSAASFQFSERALSHGDDVKQRDLGTRLEWQSADFFLFIYHKWSWSNLPSLKQLLPSCFSDILPIKSEWNLAMRGSWSQ